LIRKQDETRNKSLISESGSQQNQPSVDHTLFGNGERNNRTIRCYADHRVARKDPKANDSWSSKRLPCRERNQREHWQLELPRKRENAHRTERCGVRRRKNKGESNRTAQGDEYRKLHSVRSTEV
jgi:hypothetical protein